MGNFNPTHSLFLLQTSNRTMKVIFGGETKRIPEIQNFEELLKYAATIFNASQLNSQGNDLKLFYQDDEGDIISVTC